MPYSKLLKKIMKETKTTNKEIVDRSKEIGKPINKTYLSKLVNGNLPAPTEEKSRTISQICDVDERLLVLEGYLDKAPKEITDMLTAMKEMTILAAIGVFENEINEKDLKEFRTAMQEVALAEFVIQTIDNKDYNITMAKDMFKISTQDEKLNFDLSSPISITINDDAMSPKIPKSSKVIVELMPRYVNGDIILIKVIKTEELLARIALFVGRQVILVPLDKSKDNDRTYHIDDIHIIGKIKQVITSI